jgi:hypothetical protein
MSNKSDQNHMNDEIFDYLKDNNNKYSARIIG